MKSSNERKRGRARGASTVKPGAPRMGEDEKDRRRFARIGRMALAAQMAVECVECGEAGKISSQGVPPLTSAPPLWIVENEWLLESFPFCADCIEAGARLELCFEGGTQHKFCQVGDHMICPDCRGDCEDPKIGSASTELIRMRLEGAMVAREAEIGLLVLRMATVTLDGPELAATTTRLERLREDRDWTARRLAVESPR